MQSCIFTDIDLGVLVPFVDAYRVSNDKKAAELSEKTKNKKTSKKRTGAFTPKTDDKPCTLYACNGCLLSVFLIFLSFLI